MQNELKYHYDNMETMSSMQSLVNDLQHDLYVKNVYICRVPGTCNRHKGVIILIFLPCL